MAASRDRQREQYLDRKPQGHAVFAAWILREHPNLKYAAWSEENTVKDNEVDDAYDGFRNNRPESRLTVTITADRPEGLGVMEDSQLIQARNDQQPRAADGKALGAEIVELHLLESPGTNQACRRHQYQLQPDATGSEANKSGTFPNAIMEAEDKYFHRKALDFSKCMDRCTAQGPFDSILYLGAMAANDINMLQEELMSRCPSWLPQAEEDGETGDDGFRYRHDSPGSDVNDGVENDNEDGDRWGSGFSHGFADVDNLEEEHTLVSDENEVFDGDDSSDPPQLCLSMVGWKQSWQPRGELICAQ